MVDTTAVTSSMWQGEVLNGKFRIGPYLGGSGHSSVFLAEYGEQHSKAAVKIIPVQSEDPARLAQIEKAAALSHPHLLAILEAGFARLRGATVLYIVMEYAEEDLSLVLQERALSEKETREMLRPLLEALAFLHGNGYIHGALKPSNILAIGDQLKLSSDRICATGSRPAARHSDPHDAPEIAVGPLTPAADMWSLGPTIIEILTQRFPERRDSQVLVPDDLPVPFPQIARRCLVADPARRWNAADVAACLPISASPQSSSDARKTLKLRQWGYPALGAAALAVIGWLLFLQPHASRTEQATPSVEQHSQQVRVRVPAAEEKPSAAQPASPTLPTEPASLAPASAPNESWAKPGHVPLVSEVSVSTSPAQQTELGTGVVHRVIPEVPQKAMKTIEGKVRNSIRVTVDPSGSVKEAQVESAGPSRYFANFSLQSAREWKFVPRDGMSEWVITFEYRQNTIRAKASESRR